MRSSHSRSSAAGVVRFRSSTSVTYYGVASWVIATLTPSAAAENASMLSFCGKITLPFIVEVSNEFLRFANVNTVDILSSLARMLHCLRLYFVTVL